MSLFYFISATGESLTVTIKIKEEVLGILVTFSLS